MTSARFHTIEEIYRAALEQRSDQISAFLNVACEGDQDLRRKVEALLSSRERAAGFIETSAAGIATRIIGNGRADLLVGQTFGHYKISKGIGSGGMGEVYLATDVTAGRKAALKLLPARFTGDAERLRRFRLEARAVLALNHPNILTVYEIGEDHSTHYIVSELIEGETLHQCLKRGHLQVSEAVDVAIQVASALAVAHEAGIVHRDIKPENIMLRPDGYVKVLDFGVAKLAEQEAPTTMPKDEALLLVETTLGSILGTVRYMSPEQTCGTPVDKRTDIWSLGIVLYEMMTGHAPFTGDTPREVMSSIFEKDPPPLTKFINQIPAALQQIISKMLRKDRIERYQSAAEVLEALKDLRRKLEFKAELERSTIVPSWLRWTRSPMAVALALIVSAFALALPFYRHRNLAISLPPDKSVAVLPFENLNKDDENASFAGGVQDEILSSLAKIADLKVISRTSVMKYKSGTERNLREIGKTLGISHVVEGSVQRVGGRVRVGAKLIDARTDRQLWAEHYDRDVADVFAIQTEIAQRIADQLRSKLSAGERVAIAERPTTDLIAYALYTEARALGWGKLGWGNWDGAEKTFTRKLKLLEEATRRDPNFALAYCALAQTEDDLYDQTGDRTHLELAKKAAHVALRLRPDFGETHLELARYYFYADDFDRAREELVIARRTLPNNSEAIFLAARIDRRQNRWDESLANLQKASELDPRNTEIDYHLKRNYRQMRRYAESERRFPQESDPDPAQNLWVKLQRAELKLDEGDPVAAQALLAQVPLHFSPTEEVWNTRFTAALYLRDYDEANRVIAAAPANLADRVFGGAPPDSWAHGLITGLSGDKGKAQQVFASARKSVDATWGDKNEEYFALVARLDAGLGRKAEAIVEARRAVDLLPIAKDSWLGPGFVTNLALVYAWTGERDLAINQLEIVARIPAGPSYGDLRFNPCWDSLRGDPRFGEIVASLAPKSLAGATSLAPEKSIAVLPLENLSDEKDNAFFAAGIQDELLSNLSKIKDLKVISRTSVMQYKSGSPRNIREIGEQLGVAHVLEGTVQRTANRVKVSAQLIDARTDAHLWSQTYDRDLVDVFALQSEIANTIANQLHATLSPAEEAAIAERPTADLLAYAFYTKAKEIEVWGNWDGAKKGMAQKVELLEKATQRDPNFALAYCALAKTHGDLYDGTHLELAKKAAEAALRVRPDLGEAHRELARYCYYTRDFDRARDELTVAQHTLPNDSETFRIAAQVDCRRNRWGDGLTNLQKASALDPRNTEVTWHLGRTYLAMRRYRELEQLITKEAASGTPEDPWSKMVLAEIRLAQGDPGAAQALLAQLPLEFSPIELIWITRFNAALYLRDYDAANRVIAATPAKFANDIFLGQPPQSCADGEIARARGDKEKALAVFATARKNADATWGDKPKDQFYFELLAKVDAGLGRNEEAIREALRAVDLKPIANDAVWGPELVTNLALVYAWTGERDRALEQLEKVATIPAGPTYGDLRFNPRWDDLRGDPRFDKIVAAAKAASKYALEPLPEKSIAVLPLENLSDEKENAFFASGIHDEVLSNLSKIKDLKVISRRSVMQYKSGNPRNIREIGQQLGVAHVVEGSVQRAANRVKVSAQLIDARTDAHLWAQTYDRDLTDVFAIQSEIARTIANQLQAKLSATESAAIAEPPTADLVAYAYYTKAKEIEVWSNWEGAEKSMAQKVGLLEKAIQRDPTFALAYCALAKTQMYLSNDPKDLELAKKAAETALRVRPDFGEAHLELARYYWLAVDYERAHDELAIVRRKLPNNAEALWIEAMIGRHENRWDASLANLQKANALDPRNSELAWDLGRIYFEMRRYSELEKFNASTGPLEDPWTKMVLAEIKMAQGDPVAAQSLLEQVPLDFSPDALIWGVRFAAALYLRDYDAANQVIAATPAKWADSGWAEGQVARARGDNQKALAAFAAARKRIEAKWGDKPKDAPYFADIAKLDAGLGRKEEAIREGRRAVELEPIAKDAVNGPGDVAALALVYTWTGERDRALEQLEILATIPGSSQLLIYSGVLMPTYGDLLLNPCWDDLRSDPRFDKIVAAAKAASR